MLYERGWALKPVLSSPCSHQAAGSPGNSASSPTSAPRICLTKLQRGAVCCGGWEEGSGAEPDVQITIRAMSHPRSRSDPRQDDSAGGAEDGGGDGGVESGPRIESGFETKSWEQRL